MSQRVASARWGRWAAVAALALVAVVAGLLLVLRHRLAASLPRVRGSLVLPGLGQPVQIERDALGVPTVRASNRLDASFALGFLHGQDRFFQMDLLRRQSAGELAELAGKGLVKADLRRRLHRFRALARRALALATPEQAALLAAYSAGVNAGLRSLRGRPLEYEMLRAAPAPWRPEDTLLTTYSMFLVLEDEDGGAEAGLAWLHAHLPRALFEFLEQQGTEWDAPLIGGPLPPVPVPGPEVADLRRSQSSRFSSPAANLLPARGGLLAAAGRLGLHQPWSQATAHGGDELAVPSGWGPWSRSRPRAAMQADGEAEIAGSNNWAVAGARTASGHALLANDMHLALAVPNTWYRAALFWHDPRGVPRQVIGVTLPGTPGVVVGSNGHVAWGFTDSYGDWTDLVELDLLPGDPETYRTPAGPRRLEHHAEVIHVHGGRDVTLDVRSTIWGPVVPGEGPGRLRAVSWIAHFPEAVNLDLARLEQAQTAAEALAIAHAAGIPPENFVVADSQGHIGWTIIGRIPRRVGFDGRLPTSWADGSRRWDGWLTSAEVPTILDPSSGCLWTANARTLSGAGLALEGDGGYALGARARQIRDRLLALERATPADMLALQLDDRALFLERWRALLLATLEHSKADGGSAAGRRAELSRLVAATWSGRAEPSSVAYRVVREFRDAVMDEVFRSLAFASAAPPETVVFPRRQFEGPLWQLLTARPPHLLDPRFRSWDDLLLAAIDEVIDSASADGGLARHTWGRRNTASIRHPLSPAVPVLGRYLDMPADPLPGDENMPRVQGPRNGASERLVVSPGHEEEGLFHMPAGQSGHPMSPHYRDGHRAWEEGAPTPFLPGPPVDTLQLLPAPPRHG